MDNMPGNLSRCSDPCLSSLNFMCFATAFLIWQTHTLCLAFSSAMEHRLTVDAITPALPDWVCKIQVVEKFRPRDSKDHTVHFQTVIVQDENEQQVAIVLYGDDIDRFHDLFTLFETYLLSGAKVRDPRPYSIPVHKFEWVADRYTIAEPITNEDTSETPLPPPAKFNVISFLDLDQKQLGVEFDLLAVIANCSELQYTANQTKRYREAIIMDNKKMPFMFTIWDDLADNEGAALMQQVHEHPIILAKRVAVTEYRKVRRVATRYSSTISINPSYTQTTALMNWSKENEQMLMTYILRSSSASCSALNLAPIEDEIVSISTIPTMSSTVQMFSIEGNISLPDRFQSYYMLACSNCNHFVRSKTQRKIKCLHCVVRTMLIPRCYFEVDITDSSDTLTVAVSEMLAEDMLSMTAEQVYNTVATKHESPPVAQINRKFGHRLYKIQLHKPPFRIPYQKINTLAISSFSEREPMFFGSLPGSTFPGEASKKPKKQ